MSLSTEEARLARIGQISVEKFGEIDGKLVSVTGREVQIEYPGATCVCSSDKVASELSLIVGLRVRLYGMGTWTRDDKGTWTVVFKVYGGYELDETPLTEVFANLRSGVPA